MSQIFISYSRKDIVFVDQLVSRLNAAGYELWIDRLGIRGGEQWRREIVNAIGGSDVLILVLSRNSVKSDNVCKELDLAEDGRKRILPIVIQSVTIPPDFEYQLAGRQNIYFTKGFDAGFSQLLKALTPLVGPPKPATPSPVTPAPLVAAQHPWPSRLATDKVPILVGSCLLIGVCSGLLVVILILAIFFINPLKEDAEPTRAGAVDTATEQTKASLTPPTPTSTPVVPISMPTKATETFPTPTPTPGTPTEEPTVEPTPTPGTPTEEPAVEPTPTPGTSTEEPTVEPTPTLGTPTEEPAATPALLFFDDFKKIKGWDTSPIAENFGEAVLTIAEKKFTWVVTSTDKPSWFYVQLPHTTARAEYNKMTVEVNYPAIDKTTVEVLMLFRLECSSYDQKENCKAGETYRVKFGIPADPEKEVGYYDLAILEKENECEWQFKNSKDSAEGSDNYENPVERSDNYERIRWDEQGKLILTVIIKGSRYALEVNGEELAELQIPHEGSVSSIPKHFGIGVRLPDSEQTATIEFHRVTVADKPDN